MLSCMLILLTAVLLQRRGRKGSTFYNDLLVYDNTTGQWTLGPKCPCLPRANHTATLVGSKIWIIGGGARFVSAVAAQSLPVCCSGL
jgi:hypothetical protein